MLNRTQRKVERKKPTLRLKIETNAEEIISQNNGSVPTDFQKKLKIKKVNVLSSE